MGLTKKTLSLSGREEKSKGLKTIQVSQIISFEDRAQMETPQFPKLLGDYSRFKIMLYNLEPNSGLEKSLPIELELYQMEPNCS